jgi:hypothetical protein
MAKVEVDLSAIPEGKNVRLLSNQHSVNSANQWMCRSSSSGEESQFSFVTEHRRRLSKPKASTLRL